MARKDTPDEAPAKQGRLAQIRSAYTMTRKVDPAVGWVTAATAFLVLAVAVAIGFLIGHPIYLGIMGLMVAVLAATIVFGKRAEKAAFSQVDGQPALVAPLVAAQATLRSGTCSRMAASHSLRTPPICATQWVSASPTCSTRSTPPMNCGKSSNCVHWL